MSVFLVRIFYANKVYLALLAFCRNTCCVLRCRLQKWFSVLPAKHRNHVKTNFAIKIDSADTHINHFFFDILSIMIPLKEPTILLDMLRHEKGTKSAKVSLVFEE